MFSAQKSGRNLRQYNWTLEASNSTGKRPMSAKLFFDTNVLIYCYTSTEPEKMAVAQELVQSTEAWISTQTLQELSNTLYKKFNKSWPEIALVCSELQSNFEVFVNLPQTLTDALRIAEKYRYSLYDSLVISSCLSIGCEILYSEDLQHGQVIDGTLTIQNPFLKS